MRISKTGQDRLLSDDHGDPARTAVLSLLRAMRYNWTLRGPADRAGHPTRKFTEFTQHSSFVSQEANGILCTTDVIQELVEIQETLQRNLETIRAGIGRACSVAGRAPDDVRLIAVTKYAQWDWVCALSELHSTFGESRPQQLAERQPQLPHVEWHLIGQLQRNKARSALQHASMIHSVDSLKLLQRLSQLCSELDRTTSVLLQVNISGESSKAGFDPGVLEKHWGDIVSSTEQRVRIAGLMTMAPLGPAAESARPVFAGLRELRNRLNSQGLSPELTELSMGMSRDFEVAVQEGATLIRIGRSLFEGLGSEES